MEKKVVVVSEDFVNIYRHFNVYDQIDKVNKLSEREKYLLLMACIDLHSEDDPVVTHNLSGFKPELEELDNMLADSKYVSDNITELINETGDYIETDNIVDSTGKKLPDPFSKDEVRDLKISLIDGENLNN